MSKKKIEKVTRKRLFLEMFLYLCHDFPEGLAACSVSGLIISFFSEKTFSGVKNNLINFKN